MSDYERDVRGFDQIFAIPMRGFVPTLLRMAEIGAGQRVLDVAAGTGISTEMVVMQVGRTGSVVATDISPIILRTARLRLDRYSNIIFSAQDGQHLTFPDGSFDAVICSMALHLFPRRLVALQGFRNVLRDGGYAAVSVNTTAEQSMTGRLNRLVAQHHPTRSAELLKAHLYSLGEPEALAALFTEAGFRDVKAIIEQRTFDYESFDAYFATITGGGPWGADYKELSEEQQQLVKQQLRQEMNVKDNQPFENTVAILYGSGRK
jgi:ubiquinone/menaquinone biosynthesis C-methylase UbiE